MMKKLIVIGLFLLILCPVLVQSKEKQKKIICTTMDLQREYVIIGVETAFSLDMLKRQAKKINADAIIGIRLSLNDNAILYYGTIVKFLNKK